MAIAIAVCAGMATTSNATATAVPRVKLTQLAIAAPSHQSTYSRTADFGGWASQGHCQNTRTVLLIRTSTAPVTFTTSSHCTVKTGRWTDPWSGVTTTVAHDFDVDHTVPLANAWRSGAWHWTKARRVAYANDLVDPKHLVAIALGENRSKGDSGPESWKPPNRGAWCTYARTWDRIKAKWHLSATQAEWNALVAMAKSCR